MAVQIHQVCRPIPRPLSSSIVPLFSWPVTKATVGGDVRRSTLVKITGKTRKSVRPSMMVRSSLETSGSAMVVGQVTEVDKDTFWPIVDAAGDKTVVLDMYTQW